MSRADRRKQKKLGLKVWVPVISIIVVGVTFYMLHDIQGKVDKMKQENVLNVSSNQTIQNNITENVVNNEVENTNILENVSTNTSTNTLTNNLINNSTKNNKTTSSAGITDKKQKAIELVKEEWGKDDTVNFVFDYVNENGEYVVSVKDKNSATVKCYYRVDLNTLTVELD